MYTQVVDYNSKIFIPLLVLSARISPCTCASATTTLVTDFRFQNANF